LCELYEGRFLSNNFISDTFREYAPKSALVGIEDKIRAVKKDWQKVHALVLEAAQRYVMWHDPTKEPISKKQLTLSMRHWLYSPVALKGSSFFLRCCVEDPADIREFFADKIYETLPEEIQNIGISIYRTGLDSVAFWARIRDVYEWGLYVHGNLKNEVQNISWWFSGGVIGWLDSYCNWIVSTFGADSYFIGNIGVGNATWRNWVNMAVKKHRISNSEILQLPIEKIVKFSKKRA
jgi:hypothetical protein